MEKTAHPRALECLFRECIEWIHAFELNGTRAWKENAETIALARTHGRPIISGGDRHACEPSACINLTNARTFAEFAAEIREGHSTVVFLPHYREPMALRILQASWDILRRYPEYPGRTQWTDRVYYRGEDGTARPLSLIWKDRVPWMLTGATGMVELFATTKLRSAIRLLLMSQSEMPPLTWTRPARGFWKRQTARRVFNLSLEGVTAHSLALSVALALVIGVFPVYGCPTLLCAAAAIVLRLNLPAMQLVNVLTTPLQLALLIPFHRLGNLLIPTAGVAGPRVSAEVHSEAWRVVDGIWTLAVHAVAGWFCICAPLGLLLYLTLRYASRRWYWREEKLLIQSVKL